MSYFPLKNLEKKLAYKVHFKKSVGKEIKKLNPKEKKRIVDKIEVVLSQNPRRFPLLSGRFAGLRKFRIGSYRVVFSILDNEVWVLHVKHRKDIYRK